MGHREEECWRKHPHLSPYTKKKEEEKGKGDDKGGVAGLTIHDFVGMAAGGERLEEEQKGTTWVADSGSTCHLTGDIQCLTDYQVVVGPLPTIMFGDGIRASIEGFGKAEIKVGENRLTLTRVGYLPALQSSGYRLISIPTLVKNGLKVHFSTEGCELTNARGGTLIIPRAKGLYCVPSAPLPPSSVPILVSPTVGNIPSSLISSVGAAREL